MIHKMATWDLSYLSSSDIEISCLATAFTPFLLRNRQSPLRIYRHRVETKPMADFLASPGFVTCTVAAAHDGSADSLLAFTGVGQRKARLVKWRVWRLGRGGFWSAVRNYDELRLVFKNLFVTDPRKLKGIENTSRRE
jgi:hypothetical protein